MSFLPKRFMMIILRFQLMGKVLIAKRTRVWSIVEVIPLRLQKAAKDGPIEENSMDNSFKK